MMHERLLHQTFYELLEIQPDAPQHEVHKAYQRAKETYSPQSPAIYTMFTREEATALLRLIDEAFETLSNQRKRQEYDLKLLRDQHNKGMSGPILPPREEKYPNFQTPDIYDNPTSTSLDSDNAIFNVKTQKSTEPMPNAVPAGFGKTRFGIYELNKQTEEDMKTRKTFDGTYLQKIRLYKKITVDQMSEAIKISRTYLLAIETNNFQALPAPVFVRGFIVQIARILNLPENDVAKAYMDYLKKGKVE